MGQAEVRCGEAACRLQASELEGLAKERSLLEGRGGGGGGGELVAPSKLRLAPELRREVEKVSAEHNPNPNPNYEPRP